MTEQTLLPCPFCGHVGVDFIEGSTFHWRFARCAACGASAGEDRVQTLGKGTPIEWEAACRERLIAAWNRRAPTAAVQADTLDAALAIALEALESIALAGMGLPMEACGDEDAKTRFHADQAWSFIRQATIAKEAARAAMKDSNGN